jgi:hypothetical protein
VNQRHKARAEPYATLSHCWGLAQITKLLTTNRSDFEHGIPLSSLPPTFQHAVRVVRLLGIRYLWIDSLCIMQDSQPDWEVESARMASVYGHAVLNLAASSSSSSAGGLFFDRDPDAVQPFAAYSPGGSGAMLAEGWYVWKDDGRWGRVGESPLNRRGWVLQERLLSNRTAHFTRSEVIWHCLEDLASESVPNQVPDPQLAVPVMQIRDYTDIRITVAEAVKGGLKAETMEKLYKGWKSVLVQYTKCELTNGNDKLIALFGIADRLERLMGDQCLAGLWRSQMPGCLLWRIDWGPIEPDGETTIPGNIQARPDRWRAPSWSWASHNLGIHYVYFPSSATRHSQIIETAVVRKQNGSMISGRLGLRGPVVEVELDLTRGEIVASRECVGTILTTHGRLSLTMYVWSDGIYERVSPIRALLVVEEWAFFLWRALKPSRAYSVGLAYL